MPSVSTRWVNPGILRWARERLGLSYKQVEDFSKKLEGYAPIHTIELQKWEREASEPDLAQLETLSEIYVCPVGYFFLPNPPEESLPLNFRGLSPDKDGKLNPLSQQTLRRFLELAEWTMTTIEEKGVEWKVKIQHAKAPSDVDALVKHEKEKLGYTPQIRANWSNAHEAFMWWRKKIEEQGIFCFQMKLETADIRGASTWLGARYPFILVNHQDIEAAAGRIFTLLHEYAHLLMSKDGLVCDFRGRDSRTGPEPLANRFAARMLLTYEEVKQRLAELGKHGYNETWPDPILDEIRKPFFVSRDVVAITLQEMKLTAEDFYQQKRKLWDKKQPWGRGGTKGGLTKRERKLREIGFSLTRVLTMHGRDQSVPLTGLSYVLDMKVEKVREFLTWARNEVGSAA